jgi:hypothetical protein
MPDPTLGAFEANLILPAGHESRRADVVRAVADAVDIVHRFAVQHGWSSHVTAPFFRGVELYLTQEELWQRILELNDVQDVPVPTDALTAALEKDILLAVVREEAERARPEYFQTEDDWVRALAHEMIHRLHVRILGGNENAMGPQWFYEGFAVLGSGQALGIDQRVDDVDNALSMAAFTGRGAYARYAAAIRFFAERIPLQRLVANAERAAFQDWLRGEVGTAGTGDGSAVKSNV